VYGKKLLRRVRDNLYASLSIVRVIKSRSMRLRNRTRICKMRIRNTLGDLSVYGMIAPKLILVTGFQVADWTQLHYERVE